MTGTWTLPSVEQRGCALWLVCGAVQIRWSPVTPASSGPVFSRELPGTYEVLRRYVSG